MGLYSLLCILTVVSGFVIFVSTIIILSASRNSSKLSAELREFYEDFTQ